MKRQPAFTLVECVGALLVTSLVVVLLSLTMTAVRTISQRSLDGAVDWLICLQELESPDHQFALERVTPTELQLKDQHQQRKYQLRIGDRLYLRAPNGGYMPIFSGIRGGRSFFRRLDSQRVYIEVERNNGQKMAGIICFEKDE